MSRKVPTSGGLIIDCRFLALFLGLVFVYFDLEGMTLLRKMLSVRLVCCHSFELVSTKLFVRFQVCRKKVGNTYHKRHRPVPVKTNCVKQRRKETQLPRMALLIRGTLRHVNSVFLFLKNGNFKLRKDKNADPVIRQLNVTLWLFQKGKKEETFEIYFV